MFCVSDGQKAISASPPFRMLWLEARPDFQPRVCAILLCMSHSCNYNEEVHAFENLLVQSLNRQALTSFPLWFSKGKVWAADDVSNILSHILTHCQFQ